MDIQGVTQDQLISFCQKSQANPGMVLFFVLSIVVFIISFLLIVDLRKTDVKKLIFAGIIFSFLMGLILLFLTNSPMLINRL